jgi:hypothetical protein
METYQIQSDDHSSESTELRVLKYPTEEEIYIPVRVSYTYDEFDPKEDSVQSACA